MSDVAKTCLPEQDMSSGSWSPRCPDHPLSSAPQVPQRPKRVRFYKSGDPHFSGLQVVINSRAFKTFDALLDNLSKKVPLPFGVRNITTPRGTRVVRSLDELEDGKSYLCSDKRKIHPINLDVVNRRPVTGDVENRLSNPEDSPLVQTPKWLMVFRNGDAGVKHRVDLQAIQTWESVLESMSEVLHIPVQKIYTMDGRKVASLSGLALCSSGIVASAGEHFKPARYQVQGPAQTRWPPTKEPLRRHTRAGNANSPSSDLKSKKDITSEIMSSSSSSSLFDFPSNRSTSEGVTMNDTTASEPILCTADGRAARPLLPPDGDIEKSFCINEDGSMTVEMKVRLKVKEKEILHWTTTLMRSTVAKRRRPGCDPRPESTAVPPDLDDIPNIFNGYKSSEDLAQAGDQLNKGKPCFWRPGTPGPRHTRKLGLVESLSTSSDTGVVENVIGAYSSKEEGPNMDKTKGHQLVWPIPKPRTVKLTEAEYNRAVCISQAPEVLQMHEKQEEIPEAECNRAVCISQVPEVLQMHEKQEEIPEAECNRAVCISQAPEVLQMHEKQEEIPGTTLHRRKQQSCYNNEVNTEDQNVCELLYQHSVSEDAAPLSSSYDRDDEQNHISITSTTLNERQSERFPLLSEEAITSYSDTNHHSSFSDSAAGAPHLVSDLPPADIAREAQSQKDETDMPKPSKRKPDKQKNTKPPSTSADKTQTKDTTGIIKDGERAMPLKVPSQTGEQKNSDQEGAATRTGQKLKKTEKLKANKNRDTANMGLSFPQNAFVQKEHNARGRNIIKGRPSNVDKNYSTVSLTRDTSDALPHANKTVKKRTSLREIRMGLREGRDLGGSVSLPPFHRGVTEYVENWLDKIDTETIHCIGETNTVKTDGGLKGVFQIGSDSTEESEMKDETKKLSGKECLPFDCNINESQMLLNTSEMVLEKMLLDEMQILETLDLSVQEEPAIQEPPMRLTGSNPEAPQPDTMPVLEKLCTSAMSNRHMSNYSCLEKSHSVPDFMSCAASTFSPFSRFLTAFPSAMTLNEGLAYASMRESLVNNVQSQSEPLKVIKCLQGAATIEDAVKLMASQSDLQNYTSFLQRSVVELNGRTRNCTLSSLNSSNEFNPLNGENSNKFQETPNTEELLEEHGMSEEFRKDLSSLVRGEINIFNANDQPSQDLIEFGKVKNAQCESSESHRTCEDSEVSSEDDKIMTFKRGSHEDEKVNCKGERASFEDTVVTEVRSGASDVISNESHFPLSEHSAKGFVGKTPERCRRTQLSEDTSNQWKVKEDRWDTRVEDPSSSGSVEIPKDLLDFVNSALHSSTLTFSYDSKGSLKIEVEGTNIKLTHRIPRSSTDVQYDHKRLPSPNTSDFSDYGPEMTESDELKSQESVELITESEEDYFGGQPDDQNCVQNKIGGRKDDSEVSILKASFSAPPIKENQNQPFSCSSDRAMADDITAGPVDACDKPEQRMVHSTAEDMSEGVLIDKGQWLLKENHLIRMSPPGPLGMYGNMDTTSASTGQENGSDDIPASYFVGPASTTAALSSSELEEMVKPKESTKLAYFAMQHGSDSDPFQGELSSRSSAEDTVATSRESMVNNKEEVSIYSNTKNPGTWAKRMSRLNSFTSVEFKIPDGKVCPSTALPAGVLAEAQDARSQNHRARMIQEQRSVNVPCGPHCPIL
nr:oxygen-regulated protein 1-like [Paramormyrops kingsleyae]